MAVLKMCRVEPSYCWAMQKIPVECRVYFPEICNIERNKIKQKILSIWCHFLLSSKHNYLDLVFLDFIRYCYILGARCGAVG